MGARYNWAVGRKAEDLVHDMMKDLGFDVFRFGYEHLFKKLANKKKALKGLAGEFVRSQPDFLIVDPKDNHAYFIEVKYRKEGKIKEESIRDYPENYIVLVSPKGLLIESWEYAIKHEDNNCFKRLTKIGPFRHKNPTVIMKYVNKAKDFY